MPKAQLNIEYSHFYISDGIGAEQRRGLHEASQVLQQINVRNTLLILIDDKANNDSDQKEHLLTLVNKELSVNDRKPDFIVRESKLIEPAKELLAAIPGQQIWYRYGQDSCEAYLKTSRNKARLWRQSIHSIQFSCALLSAAWLLCRLGELAVPQEAKLTQRQSVSLEAEHALTILPTRYKTLERRCHAILSVTKFSSALSRLSYKYFV